MSRRVWIIETRNIIEQDIREATEHNCSEIARGIPPILHNIITEDMLPCLYEEPVVPINDEKSIREELEDLKTQIELLREEPRVL